MIKNKSYLWARINTFALGFSAEVLMQTTETPEEGMAASLERLMALCLHFIKT